MRTPKYDRSAISTEFGRNSGAIAEIPNLVRKDKKTVAWVVGLGGKTTKTYGTRVVTPTEHYEVAKALEYAGVKDFSVYASDADREISREAKKLNEAGVIRINGLELVELKSIQRFHPQERLRIFESMLAHGNANLDDKLIAEKGKPTILLKIGDLAGKIKVLEGKTANAFLGSPSERPNLILCNNVGRHYDKQGRMDLASRLAEALSPGGHIIISNNPEEKEFFEQLISSGLKLKKSLEHFAMGITHFVFVKPDGEKK